MLDVDVVFLEPLDFVVQQDDVHLPADARRARVGVEIPECHALGLVEVVEAGAVPEREGNGQVQGAIDAPGYTGRRTRPAAFVCRRIPDFEDVHATVALIYLVSVHQVEQRERQVRVFREGAPLLEGFE